jgi:TPR repeat protein
MHVVFILAMLLTMVGSAAAGPAEDALAANTAFRRGDFATALRLYRRAADQGHGDAANNLGVMYFRGVGVPYDDTEAAKWFRRGAELGDAKAQRNIGNAHRFGQGVPQNDVLALVWFNLAVVHGNQAAAEDREEVAKRMTPAQLAEAQKLTDEWKPKH